METTISTHQKNVSTFIHLSTFAKWFFPFGNFIAPLVLWSAQRKTSKFVDDNGRDALNFQLSILLYLISLTIISIPFLVWQGLKLDGTNAHFVFNGHIHSSGDLASASGFIILLIVLGTLAVGIGLFEIINVVSAAIKASKGETYKYPFTINFIQAEPETEEPTVSATAEGDDNEDVNFEESSDEE